ncbi:DUF7006 family protein [Enterococcus wangshanyuanii]|uniref:Uncharacterized protein n=1 Tax=Enterococcus wangshanyuanii TaxID=2005703 RepID=A0ABQ1NKM0_9ENTE|nr:hypothetical protein [Enterococcus wangshanyuanii]GGC79559.1 hypothetical protein GCM10011573_06550 [Enterococcus wangshanyuanii]
MTNDEVERFLKRYMDHYERKFDQIWLKQRYKKMYDYSQALLESLANYQQLATSDQFWLDFVQVIKIDAKLHLLAFVVESAEHSVVEISEEEMIAMIEKDHATYYSENMGFKLNERSSSSLLFLIE